MDWSALARFEWLLIELLVLALVGYEVVSIRRTLRRDREAREAERPEAPAPAAPGPEAVERPDERRDGPRDDR